MIYHPQSPQANRITSTNGSRSRMNSLSTDLYQNDESQSPSFSQEEFIRSIEETHSEAFKAFPQIKTHVMNLIAQILSSTKINEKNFTQLQFKISREVQFHLNKLRTISKIDHTTQVNLASDQASINGDLKDPEWLNSPPGAAAKAYRSRSPASPTNSNSKSPAVSRKHKGFVSAMKDRSAQQSPELPQTNLTSIPYRSSKKKSASLARSSDVTLQTQLKPINSPNKSSMKSPTQALETLSAEKITLGRSKEGEAQKQHNHHHHHNHQNSQKQVTLGSGNLGHGIEGGNSVSSPNQMQSNSIMNPVTGKAQYQREMQKLQEEANNYEIQYAQQQLKQKRSEMNLLKNDWDNAMDVVRRKRMAEIERDKEYRNESIGKAMAEQEEMIAKEYERRRIYSEDQQILLQQMQAQREARDRARRKEIEDVKRLNNDTVMSVERDRQLRMQDERNKIQEKSQLISSHIALSKQIREHKEREEMNDEIFRFKQQLLIQKALDSRKDYEIQSRNSRFLSYS